MSGHTYRVTKLSSTNKSVELTSIPKNFSFEILPNGIKQFNNLSDMASAIKGPVMGEQLIEDGDGVNEFEWYSYPEVVFYYNLNSEKTTVDVYNHQIIVTHQLPFYFQDLDIMNCKIEYQGDDEDVIIAYR